MEAQEEEIRSLQKITPQGNLLLEMQKEEAVSLQVRSWSEKFASEEEPRLEKE